jgi:hypothetical protein
MYPVLVRNDEPINFLSNFINSYMDNSNTLNNEDRFPSLLNLVASHFSTFSYALDDYTNEVRTITVYALQGFKNIRFNNINNQDEYPCGTNVAGTTCTYYEGYLSPYYLDWDRVVIYLGPAADGNACHVVIPDIIR